MTEALKCAVVHVLIPRPFHQPFTYRVEQGKIDFPLIQGDWVLVPLGKREQVIGCVWSTEVEYDGELDRLKEVTLAVSWLPRLPHSLLQLITTLSHYYHVPIGEALGLALPSLLPQKVFLVQDVEPSEVNLSPSIWESIQCLGALGPIHHGELPFYLSQGEWATLLQEEGLRELKLPRKVTQVDHIFKINEGKVWPKSKRKRVEKSVFTLLSTEREVNETRLVAAQLCSSSNRLKRALRSLIEEGFITYHPQVSSVNHLFEQADKATSAKENEVTIEQAYAQRSVDQFLLTSEQENALSEIRKRTVPTTFLLHGVTGSGKTEVYLELIEEVVLQGRQALVLLPEIGLTPQTMKRFSARLPCPIYAWHSQLTPLERFEVWHALGSGQACVLVGARSALFAPLSHLGLIIVDEAHDSSYKQGEGIRYHARDMAVLRGKLSECHVILGSATPSLESMYNTQLGKYVLLSMRERPLGAHLPTVRTVDLTSSRAVSQQAPAITQTLANAISIRLSRGEQTILFLNRRGFSQSVRCLSCGFLFTCPQCELSLPWHRRDQRLKCHHCDFSAPLPGECPQCHTTQQYAPIGRGTERIEEQLETLFPQAKIARLDRDSDLKPQALHTLMDDGEIDILIGTQMVTKGHDFPRVTLVGVIDADVGLDLPDFRVNERSFQLLSQVAGRAGRAELTGEVIVQTYRPKEERLLAAITHDYGRFYLHELQLRQAISYPPFGYLATLRVSAERQLDLSAFLRQLQELLLALKGIRIRGPSPAPMSQVGGKQRWITLLLSSDRATLHKGLHQLSTLTTKRQRGVRCHIDVDPQDFI